MAQSTRIRTESPQNLNIGVVLDEESDFEVPGRNSGSKLSLLGKAYPMKFKNIETKPDVMYPPYGGEDFMRIPRRNGDD